MSEDAGRSRFSLARSAAGALLFDDQGRLLLVEPTYKDYWDIPGGYLEPGETPTEACAREITEELGLEIEPGRLLVIDWAPHPKDGDKALFVFDGGLLNSDDIAAIKLPPDELASFAFLPVQDASQRLIPRLARRVEAAARGRASGITMYLEHGVPWPEELRHDLSQRARTAAHIQPCSGSSSSSVHHGRDGIRCRGRLDGATVHYISNEPRWLCLMIGVRSIGRLPIGSGRMC